jgi:outer membrane lipoprotein-sorting protein
MIRKTSLTFLFAVAIFCVNAQTADEILAKYFENTGGLAKWKAVKSIKMEAKVPTPQGEFPATMYMKAPNKSKMVFNIQGKELVQMAYDGETAWSLNPLAGGTDPVKLDAETSKAVQDRETESPFIDYTKKGHVVTLEGKEEVEGVQCFKIKLEKNKNNPKDDVTEFHFFDAENFVPIMQRSFIPFGPMKGQQVESYLSDYQEVSGLMVPFAIEEKMNGSVVSKILVQKISFENIDDSVFAFPKK